MLPAFVQNCGPDGPHDDVEEEESDSEHGVVDSCLLCALMSPSVVRIEDTEGECQRHTGNT